MLIQEQATSNGVFSPKMVGEDSRKQRRKGFLIFDF
jgi:hypothetical protein